MHIWMAISCTYFPIMCHLLGYQFQHNGINSVSFPWVPFITHRFIKWDAILVHEMNWDKQRPFITDTRPICSDTICFNDKLRWNLCKTFTYLHIPRICVLWNRHYNKFTTHFTGAPPGNMYIPLWWQEHNSLSCVSAGIIRIPAP